MKGPITRYNPDPSLGLSSSQVLKREKENLMNLDVSIPTKTLPQIIRGNLFTLFNLINFVLALAIIYVGSFKNLLFMGVVISNLIISTYQEIRAKKAVDKLSILSLSKINVIRDGNIKKIGINDIVLDDILELNQGIQVPTDCKILNGNCEVNESLLTGESDSISKGQGDLLLSGSYIVSGKCKARVENVGKENYAFKISKDAKYVKKINSQILSAFNKIILILSILIIPIGFFLFTHQLNHNNLENSIINTTAALIGMIPEGLVLLTSTVLAVSVVRLSKQKVLVQELYCIETLARVDTLCLDKTGTITQGTMEVDSLVPCENYTEDEMKKYLSFIVNNTEDTNPTYYAIKNFIDKNDSINKKATEIVPFSSEKKWSGVYIDGFGSYVMGASEFIFENKLPNEINSQLKLYSKENRVVILAHSNSNFINKNLPNNLNIVGFILIKDVIRNSAKETLKYFNEQGVDIKIISGDNVLTVSNIAKRAGLKNYNKYIDLSKVSSDENIKKIANEYSIFGRVSPIQKKQLICALKESKHTVAMTGDGVNDVLALKDADVSIAMASGSEAAKNTANLVLLNSDFASLPHIVNEGRRVINNIKAAASMFLIKTGFSVLTALLTIIVGQNYPFQPIQLSVINGCAVAIPTMLLQLEPSFQKVNKHFFREVLRMSMPAAITITAMITIINNIGHSIGTPREMLSTVCVLATGWVYLITLRQVYSPMTGYRKFVIYLMQTAYLVAMVIGQRIMELVGLNFTCVIVTLAAVNFAPMIIDLATKGYDKFFYWYDHRHDVKPPKPIKVKTRRFRGV